MTQPNLLQPQPAPATLREEGDLIAPTYLRGPVFGAYRFAMAALYDLAIYTTDYAVLARFPSQAPPDAFSWIAQDRQIFQGPGEAQAGYVARLIQWLDLWRLAGSSTSVLLSVLAYLSPLAPHVKTVMSWAGAAPGSVWRQYAAGANPFPAGQTIPTPPTTTTLATANWDWDGSSQPYYYPWMRWREWVIISSFGAQAPWPAPTKTWGSGGTLVVSVVSDPVYGTVYENTGTGASPSATSFDWGDGTCWGWAGTAQQAEDLTALIKTWKSAGTWVPWIVVNYDTTWFLSTGAIGTKMPDGLWGYYSKVVSDATYGTKFATSRPPASTCTLIVGSADGENGQPLGVG